MDQPSHTNTSPPSIQHLLSLYLEHSTFSSPSDARNLFELSSNQGLWKILFESSNYDNMALNALGVNLSKFTTLYHYLASTSKIVGDGIEIPISPMSSEYIWLYLVPIISWIETRVGITPGLRKLIGIVGSPGAGKTVFSQILKVCLNLVENRQEELCCVLGMDAYHYPNQYLDSHNVIKNGHKLPLRKVKGSPISFEIPLFLNHLSQLKDTSTSQLQLPVYDRNLHDRVDNALQISPHHKYIIVEGMFLLLQHQQLDPNEQVEIDNNSNSNNNNSNTSYDYEKISELLDVTFFIDVDIEDCHTRLVKRKVDGGRDPHDAENHYQNVDRPNILRIQETKNRADVVLRINRQGLIYSAVMNQHID